jgi:hypothetical protein
MAQHRADPADHPRKTANDVADLPDARYFLAKQYRVLGVRM